MKKSLTLFLFCLFAISGIAGAQHMLQPPLQLSHNKTTSLIFPFPIKSVDRGSSAILAQVPPEARNILQLKAAGKGFPETNLTVITSDGNLFCFPVSYAYQPAVTIVQVARPGVPGSAVLLTGPSLNDAQLQVICDQLETSSRLYYGIRDKAGGMKAAVPGIYTYGNMFFIRITLTNNSTLPFKIDRVGSTLRDRRQLRRTATQEEEVLPAYLYGLGKTGIAQGEKQVLILALERPRLPKSKLLVLDIYEQPGGRHLTLKVRPRHLQQASPLSLDTLF